MDAKDISQNSRHTVTGKLKVLVLTGQQRGWPAIALETLADANPQLELSVILAPSGPRGIEKKIKRALGKIAAHGIDVVIGGMWMRRRLDNVTMAAPTIEEVCVPRGIKIHVQTDMNSAAAAALACSLAPDVVLSLGNGWLSKRIYGCSRIAALNVHHEMLPDFPGAPPVIHSLAAGLPQTGYTIHQLTPQIDRGPIVARGIVPIRFESSLELSIEKTITLLYHASAKELSRLLSTSTPEFGTIEIKEYSPQTHYTTPTLRVIIKARRTWKAKLKSESLAKRH
ncbi:MAG: formyltransferase family protein [Pyrinomonadaceae bacterium]